MRNFKVLGDGLDVVNAVNELNSHNELWNVHNERIESKNTEHREVSDIWLRYIQKDKILEHKSPFIPVWYEAWDILKSVKPIVYSIAAACNTDMIGGVLITKIPPKQQVYPHVDTGWHVDFYDKVYVQLQGNKDQKFYCEDEEGVEEFVAKTGDIYLFDNRKKHWVVNDSGIPRMTLIICLKTEMFGRK